MVNKWLIIAGGLVAIVVAAVQTRIDSGGAPVRVAAPESIQAACAPAPLGDATDFNVFILDDLIQQGSDTGGRLAVGGAATLTDYSVAASLTPTAIPSDSLVVGGDLTFSRGAVATGNAVSGGPARLTNVTFAPGGRYRQDADLPATGAVRVEYGQIFLTGDNRSFNVFAVSGADLAAANSITVQVPVGSTALVNISGATAQLRHLGFALTGASRHQVLYNFPDATALLLDGVGVEGSVLAPQAQVAFTNGVIEGTLIGRALTGPGQANPAPFTGCLPPL